jgi:hypothetical protein
MLWEPSSIDSFVDRRFRGQTVSWTDSFVDRRFRGQTEYAEEIAGWQNYGKTRDNGVTMASDSNITLPAELLAQVQALAAKEGKTVDELMVEALKRDIARRMIANLKREGKPSGMAEDGEIQAAVDAVHEYRGR